MIMRRRHLFYLFYLLLYFQEVKNNIAILFFFINKKKHQSLSPLIFNNNNGNHTPTMLCISHIESGFQCCTNLLQYIGIGFGSNMYVWNNNFSYLYKKKKITYNNDIFNICSEILIIQYRSQE